MSATSQIQCMNDLGAFIVCIKTVNAILCSMTTTIAVVASFDSQPFCKQVGWKRILSCPKSLDSKNDFNPWNEFKNDKQKKQEER